MWSAWYKTWITATPIALLKTCFKCWSQEIRQKHSVIITNTDHAGNQFKRSKMKASTYHTPAAFVLPPSKTCGSVKDAPIFYLSPEDITLAGIGPTAVGNALKSKTWYTLGRGRGGKNPKTFKNKRKYNEEWVFVNVKWHTGTKDYRCGKPEKMATTTGKMGQQVWYCRAERIAGEFLKELHE